MKATAKVTKFYTLTKEMQEYFQNQADTKQEKWDNASEAFQDSERGDETLDEVQNLEDLANEIDDVLMNIENTYEI